jgi:hypothetical protein
MSTAIQHVVDMPIADDILTLVPSEWFYPFNLRPTLKTPAGKFYLPTGVSILG